MPKLKLSGKIILLMLVGGLAFGGFRLFKSNSASATATAGNTPASVPKFDTVKVEGDLGINTSLGRPLHVAVNQWPGWLGGIFANNGLNPNKACVYWEKYKLLVEFKVMDDPVAMINEFAAGRVDLAWSTMDTAATQLGGLKNGGTPSKILYQVDYSQGADAIVARQGINVFEDLKDKTVALIPLSPSDTLLRYGVLNSSLSESQKKGILNGKIGRDQPQDVLATFKAGKADAAVTWEPYVSSALRDVPGSKVIFSTESAATLVGDTFLAQDSFIAKNPEVIKAFIHGWFDGAFQASNDPQKSVQVMMDSFPDFKSLGNQGSLQTFNKVKLTTLADNAKTFGLDNSAPQFDTIFSQANSFYVGAVQNQVTPSDAKNDKFVRAIYNEQAPSERHVTPQEEFKFTPQQRSVATSAAPVFTKPLSITFPTGRAAITAEAKQVLDSKVIPLLRTSSNAFFRIEGNTDSTGSRDTNLMLSQQRAQAVVAYLAQRGFSAERLIPIGNGPDKPVADNSSSAGRTANRRTDIKVVAN